MGGQADRPPNIRLRKTRPPRHSQPHTETSWTYFLHSATHAWILTTQKAPVTMEADLQGGRE